VDAYIRTKLGFIHIYRIKSTPTCITGSYLHPGYLAKEINVPAQDIHFTYPSDGNVHLSLKLLEKEFEYYETVFTDKIKKKKIYKSSPQSKDVIELPRDSELTPLSFMIPTTRQAPLSTFAHTELCYRFPTACIPANDGIIIKSSFEKFIPEDKFKVDYDSTLVISVGDSETCFVNITASIFGLVNLPSYELPENCAEISTRNQLFEVRLSASKIPT
jgi:hypothetical protein